MEIPSGVIRGRNHLAALLVLSLSTLSGCASQLNMPNMPNRPSLAVIGAAGHGNPIAEYQVGRFAFDCGRSAHQRANGLAWIQLAADQNLAMAQYYMGTVYMKGQGVPQNTSLALQWIHKAAEYGAPAAQLELGDLYEAGNVIPVDDASAYFWFSVLARSVHSNITIYNIGRLQAIAKNHLANVSAALTLAQRATVDQRVAAWKPKPSAPYNGIVPLGNRRD